MNQIEKNDLTEDNIVLLNLNEILRENYDEMNIRQEILKGLDSYGLERPSTIQKYITVPSFRGCDIIFQSVSNSDIRETYSISILQQLDMNLDYCQALVLTYNRDFGDHVQNIIVSLGKFLGVACCSCFNNRKNDLNIELYQGVKVLVATPYHALILFNKRAINTKHIKIIIIDEPDLDNYRQKIDDIFNKLPFNKQVIVISANIPNDFERKFLRNPIRVKSTKKDINFDNISQFYEDTQLNDRKFEHLFELYNRISRKKSVIFCFSQSKCDMIVEVMKKKNYNVLYLHVGLNRHDRISVLNEFQKMSSCIFVVPKLLAVDIDLKNVKLIINFDLPDPQNYIHRYSHSIKKFFPVS